MISKQYRLPRSRCQAVVPIHGLRVSPRRSRHRWTGRRFATLLLTLGSWACETPDSPAQLPGSLPERLLTSLHPEEVRVLTLGPGVAFYGLQVDEGPWAIHLLQVDLARCDLGLEVIRAPEQGDLPGGRSRVTDLPGIPSRRIVGVVNGDFFTPEGLPLGTEVVGGDVRRIRDRPAFAWRPGEPPWMGTPASEGDSVLFVGWRISRNEPDGVSQVVGAFPHLLAGGRRIGDLLVSENPSFAAARHPRTAVGFDSPRHLLWIVGVDGRQPGYSDGMSLPELTGLLEAVGATDAVNLDGGGSTVMVLRGVPVSRPSDAEGERPVANALAVVRDPSFCDALGVSGSPTSHPTGR